MPVSSHRDVDAGAYLNFKTHGTNHPWFWIPPAIPGRGRLCRNDEVCGTG